MATVDWVVGGIVLILGLFVLYRGLKEPLDLFFGFVGKGLSALKDWIVGDGSDRGYTEVIQYN